MAKKRMSFLHICSFFVTWPYFRILKSHTYDPAVKLRKSIPEGQLELHIEAWKQNKNRELTSVFTAACALPLTI